MSRMDFSAALALAVVAAAVVVMAKEWLEPALALGVALGILLLFRVVPAELALEGFANPAVAAVALLLLLAASLERSPWLRWAGRILLGPLHGRLALLRAMLPSALLSAFLNNTTLVAVLTPLVRDQARRSGERPSRFLMPLCFAVTMGGMCTLVGTSTNLVVDGLLRRAGGPGLGMFEFAWAGLPAALVGILYLALAGDRLVPRRDDPLDSVAQNPREYVTRVRVRPESPLVLKRVAALRHLRGLFLAGIERADGLLSPVGPEEEIRPGDTLLFVGQVAAIADLAATPGVDAAPDGPGGDFPSPPGFTRLVEAVVSPSSPLAGRNVRESGFRGRYDAVIVAVHRHGARIESRIGDIVIHPGDTLLLQAGPDFLRRWRYSQDFLLAADAGALPAPRVRPLDWIEPAVLAAVVAASATGTLKLFEASAAGVGLLLATRRLRPAEVWSSLPWPTLLTIALSVGLGNALVASGAAEFAARGIVGAGSAFGPVGVVAVTFLACVVLTELISNVATASIVLPMALAAAAKTGIPAAAMAVAVAVGASTGFASPIGYQTNALVAGAGGYRFGDFLRVGLPLDLLVAAAAVTAVALAWRIG